jgi:hypothetical protein
MQANKMVIEDHPVKVITSAEGDVDVQSDEGHVEVAQALAFQDKAAIVAPMVAMAPVARAYSWEKLDAKKH